MAKASFTISDGSKVTTITEAEEIKRPDDFSIKEFVDELKQDLKHNRLSLPTMPTIAMEALMVINDVNSSAADLVKVISKDTSITARLIRYANSPFYGMVHPISAIKPAITCIGFKQVKHAIYAVCMKDVFKTSISDIQKRMEELWAHSVKVGSKAVELAQSRPEFDPEVALVAGLVHDIGKIPLLMKLCNYEALTGYDEFMDKLLHKLHTNMGKAILKRWEFDPELIAVAAEHEDIRRQPEDSAPDYVDLVQVANILSYDGTDHYLARVDRGKIGAFKRLGLTEEEGMADTGKNGAGNMEEAII
jgi:putative nucleotidyltransferase with HDIG domain